MSYGDPAVTRTSDRGHVAEAINVGGASEEMVRRRDGGGGPREWGVSQRWESRVTRANAGKSAAGREGTRRSEKTRVPEDGGLINQALIGLKNP